MCFNSSKLRLLLIFSVISITTTREQLKGNCVFSLLYCSTYSSWNESCFLFTRIETQSTISRIGKGTDFRRTVNLFHCVNCFAILNMLTFILLHHHNESGNLHNALPVSVYLLWEQRDPKRTIVEIYVSNRGQWRVPNWNWWYSSTQVSQNLQTLNFVPTIHFKTRTI